MIGCQISCSYVEWYWNDIWNGSAVILEWYYNDIGTIWYWDKMILAWSDNMYMLKWGIELDWFWNWHWKKMKMKWNSMKWNKN